MNGLRSWWMRLVRFGFRLLYYEFAWTYDWVSWGVSLGEWGRWQRAGLPFLNGRVCLEVGHGPGHLLLQLAQADRQAYGLDLSPYMSRQAARRLKKANQPVRLTQGAVQTFPFPANTFDSILSTFPTDYIIDPDALKELHRVLKQNGRFVTVPEGHLTIGGPLQAIISTLFRLTGQSTDAFSASPNDPSSNDAIWQPLLDRFEAAGFTCRIQQLRFPKSAATVIVAIKKG